MHAFVMIAEHSPEKGTVDMAVLLFQQKASPVPKRRSPEACPIGFFRDGPGKIQLAAVGRPPALANHIVRQPQAKFGSNPAE